MAARYALGIGHKHRGPLRAIGEECDVAAADLACLDDVSLCTSHLSIHAVISCECSRYVDHLASQPW